MRKLGPYLLVLVLLAIIALAADHFYPTHDSHRTEVPAAQDSLDKSGSFDDSLMAANDSVLQPDLPEPAPQDKQALRKHSKTEEISANHEPVQTQDKNWTVVLSSFPNREMAEAWKAKHPEADSIVYAANPGAYRVTGGFFANLGEAQEYQEQILEKHPDAWITRM